MKIDLHLHTNFSDGEKSVDELIRFISNKGIDIFSITDHDTIAPAELATAKAKEYNKIFIPGVEISTYYNGGEVHILDYLLDIRNELLLSFLNERFLRRIERMKETISILNRMGFDITFDDVVKTSPGPYIGRPNIAKALVEKGYISKLSEAFTDELIGNNGKAYVPPNDFSPIDAIEFVLRTGGIPVLAHPGIYVSNGEWKLKEKDIKKFVEAGLKGIEVYHSKHSREDFEYYRQIAKKYDLLITIGSDYHYADNPVSTEMPVDDEVFAEVLKCVKPLLY